MIQGHAYEFDHLRKLVGDSAVNNKRSHKKNIHIILNKLQKLKKNSQKQQKNPQ